MPPVNSMDFDEGEKKDTESHVSVIGKIKHIGIHKSLCDYTFNIPIKIEGVKSLW
jgi:hypothetical protein